MAERSQRGSTKHRQWSAHSPCAAQKGRLFPINYKELLVVSGKLGVNPIPPVERMAEKSSLLDPLNQPITWENTMLRGESGQEYARACGNRLGSQAPRLIDCITMACLRARPGCRPTF